MGELLYVCVRVCVEALCGLHFMLPVLVIAHQWRSSLGTLVATIPLSWCCSSCHGHLLALHTHARTHRRHKHLAVVVVEGFSTFFVGLLLLDAG